MTRPEECEHPPVGVAHALGANGERQHYVECDECGAWLERLDPPDTTADRR